MNILDTVPWRSRRLFSSIFFCLEIMPWLLHGSQVNMSMHFMIMKYIY